MRIRWIEIDNVDIGSFQGGEELMEAIAVRRLARARRSDY